MKTRVATALSDAIALLALTRWDQASVSLSVTTTRLPNVIRVKVDAQTQPGERVSITSRYRATVVARTLIADAHGHAETFYEVPRGRAGDTFEVSASVINRDGGHNEAATVTSFTLSG